MSSRGRFPGDNLACCGAPRGLGWRHLWVFGFRSLRGLTCTKSTDQTHTEGQQRGQQRKAGVLRLDPLPKQLPLTMPLPCPSPQYFLPS